jgi:CRISPR system Cascade subunit CasA
MVDVAALVSEQAPTYSLLDQPWIPVRTGDGGADEIGLRAALSEAHRIQAILGDPPEAVALLRLLSVIVSRSHDLGSVAAWEQVYLAGRFDAQGIDAYLERWAHRFNLFGESGFYQVPLTPEREKRLASISRLRPERASRTDSTQWDKRWDDEHTPLDAAATARALLTIQSFGVMGLISDDNDPRGKVSAHQGPLLNTAVVTARGTTLFETILLNTPPYRATGPDDVPWWETGEQIERGERIPSGRFAAWTMPTRRVALGTVETDGGEITFREAALMDGAYAVTPRIGNKLAGDDLRVHTEPWLPFRKVEGVQKERFFRPEEATPVGFSWRDLPALLALADPTRQHGVMTHLRRIAERGVVAIPEVIPIDVTWFATRQQAPLAWGVDRLSIPVVYLADEGLMAALAAAIRLADSAHRALGKALDLAVDDKRAAVRERAGLTERGPGLPGPTTRAFWASLDEAFQALLAGLPENREAAEVVWERAVKQAAEGTLLLALDRAAIGTFRIRGLAESALQQELAKTRDTAT